MEGGGGVPAGDGGGGPAVLLAPSILSADFGRLAEEVRAVEEAGAHWIHIDVMDGHFVPNLTVGPAVTRAIRAATRLPLDVHLMVEHPERFLGDFISAGAERVTVHQEVCVHLHRVLSRIRELGAEPGVALNPATPVETLGEILPLVSLVLVMTVNPGFGGQAFLPGSLGKIRRAREFLRARGLGGIHLQVDGGIDAATARGVVEAGATVLVAGSAVFGCGAGAAEGLRSLAAAVSAARNNWRAV